MNKIIDALKLAENTLRDIIRVYKFETGTPVTALAAIRKALVDHIANADKMIGCAYCDNPLFAGTKCNNCGQVVEPDMNLNCLSVQARLAAVWGYVKAVPTMQEPSIWITPQGEGWRMRFDPPVADVPLGWTPFYAAPVAREWVDLTDEELIAALQVTKAGPVLRIGRIAIAAFKEKNK